MVANDCGDGGCGNHSGDGGGVVGYGVLVIPVVIVVVVDGCGHC